MDESQSDEHDDDAPIGRILRRREVLSLLGFAGAGLALTACVPALATPTQGSPTSAPAPTTGPLRLPATSVPATAIPTLPPTLAVPTQQPVVPTATNRLPTAAPISAAVPNCIVAPALTEGPYFVDEKLERSDIRPDTRSGAISAGVPLKLNVRVFAAASGGCTPLKGAIVDVWHCDAAGVYSDVDAAKGKNFCRGLQVSDASGLASFITIYPGWYRGRAVHIHFKVRTATAAGKTHDFTSQWFFDAALSNRLFASAPYKGNPDTPNDRDSIFRQSGSKLTLNCQPDGAGYVANFELGITLI